MGDIGEVQNLQTFDPFQEQTDDGELGGAKAAETNYIHIRIQQRNGRKSLTTVQGLPQELDFKKVLKVFKKEFCCNGTIVDHDNMGKILQLQGDQRKNVSTFLVDEGIVSKDLIKIHGF